MHRSCCGFQFWGVIKRWCYHHWCKTRLRKTKEMQWEKSLSEIKLIGVFHISLRFVTSCLQDINLQKFYQNVKLNAQCEIERAFSISHLILSIRAQKTVNQSPNLHRCCSKPWNACSALLSKVKSVASYSRLLEKCHSRNVLFLKVSARPWREPLNIGDCRRASNVNAGVSTW